MHTRNFITLVRRPASSLALAILASAAAAQLHPDSVITRPRGVLAERWARHGLLHVGYSPQPAIPSEMTLGVVGVYASPVPFVSVGYVHGVAQPQRLGDYFVGSRAVHGFGVKANLPLLQWLDVTLGYERVQTPAAGLRLEVPRYFVDDDGPTAVRRADLYRGAVRVERYAFYGAARAYPLRFLFVELGVGYGAGRFRLDSDSAVPLAPPPQIDLIFGDEVPLAENRWHLRTEATVRLSVGVVL